MKKTIQGLLLITWLIPGFLFCQQKTETDFYRMLDEMYKKTVPLVHAAEVKQKGLNHYFILDTREPEEYRVSHLRGAIGVGFDHFDPKSVAGIGKEHPVLVYCSVGYRSERIGEKLREMGYTQVYNLYGGIFDWKNQGNPVVDAGGNSTEKVHTYNLQWSQWLFRGQKVY
ncbi:MAG: rhodanese-like domain-containing protein [Bacteroidia bacterium]|nr:rhodanese-like domain-containing protein [Bacteroidia bacterium]